MSWFRRRRSPAKPSAAGRSRGQRWLFRYGWLLPVGAIVIGAGILALTYAFASIPLPSEIELTSSAEVYDIDGRLIGTYSGEVRRFLVDTQKLLEKKPFIGDAVVASEDKDFYEHGGVSLRGIARAAWANLTGGEIEQGGSTISQQYIKNAVLEDPERTITRKIREAILAIKLERRYSKDEILGFYLNTIYLGRGAYGIEAAARTYFDKHANELNLKEAAYLAGIIPAPERYQADTNPEGARARRDRAIQVMVSEGYLAESKASRAMRGKVKLAPGADGRTSRQPAAYFMEWLRKEYLYPEFGEELFTRGLKIHTTLDLDMQEDAEVAIDSVLTDELLGDQPSPQTALVSMTPAGEVRALVGGRDYTNVKKARGFNFASDYPGRQAGSAFKPFTLLTAIEEGISPDSRFSGRSPVTIENPECFTDGQEWQPENYAGSSYGTLTLVQATTNSVNTIFAQLVAEIGPEPLVDLLDEFDFDREQNPPKREIEPNCSLALGTLDVTPLEMARAYAGFDARGRLPEVMPIRYITDSDGDCIREYRPTRGVECEEGPELEVTEVVDRNSADVLTQTLTHVTAEGTAVAANLPDRAEAGKTGTTQNNVDAWFAGYVPQLTTVVWMGYPPEKIDGVLTPVTMGYCADPRACRPVGGREVTGGSYPAQIWAAFMAAATEGMEPLEFPIPEEKPDEVINSPAPAPPSPTPSRSPKPSPSTEPSPEPSPTLVPTPTQSPSPSPKPTILPTDPGDESEARGRDP